jgi:hypothetical protein
MGYRYTLLVTVSAAALILTVERGPLAADIAAPIAQDRWWFSIEGQYLLFDGDKARYSLDGIDALGGLSEKLKPDDGWGVGGEIGFRPGDSAWSYVGRLRYGESDKEKDHSAFDTNYAAAFATADHQEEHIVADLEIGRDVGLGALGEGSNVRLFGGVRFAHFKGNGSTSSYYLPISVGHNPFGEAEITRKFTGIGPRVGFDALIPLADRFSLDVGAAGAVLFGKQTFKASGSYTNIALSTFDIDEKRSTTVAVPNLEASAALSWIVTDNAKFSLGYRVDSYFHVYDDGGLSSGRDQGDRIIHGPFIKLTIGSSGEGG